MRIAMAQINSWLGDFQKNFNAVVEQVEKAKKEKADLIVFPELFLFGYPPFDLLERKSVIEEQNKILSSRLHELPGDIGILLGVLTTHTGRGKPYYNSAILIENHSIQKTFHKELLPVYDVFDDSRHMNAGSILNNQFVFREKKIQLLICEDMWGWDSLHSRNPVEEIPPQSVDLVINMSVSPFTLQKRFQRMEMARKTAQHLNAPLVYVNTVGAQDELIYDGGSFAISKSGELIALASFFKEELAFVDLPKIPTTKLILPVDDMEQLHQALVLGIKDFMAKTRFNKAHLGLSGGIDSGVVACLLSEALGGENVTMIALPTRFNAELSLTLAQDLAQNLKSKFYVLPIQETFETATQSFDKVMGATPFSLRHENMQARLRGVFLMAFSNQHNSLLFTTGNKSEYASGYTTLYGDMCGAMAPIGDLLKGQVYQLAHWINRDREVIPQRMINRPPSAELRENQKDSDSLPAYDLLDQAVDRLVCKKQEAESSTEQWLLRQLYLSEFKRWQAPPILKISDHAFGRGRRMPIAHRARQ